MSRRDLKEVVVVTCVAIGGYCCVLGISLGMGFVTAVAIGCAEVWFQVPSRLASVLPWIVVPGTMYTLVRLNKSYGVIRAVLRFFLNEQKR